ncbi:glycoside hydrolase [Limtongia smithiae]|uniref:glycoside hydrolase n=1 Tax=Limtongia smithiae TaxID=1125753 RepID=UPI0034CFF42D
MAPPWAPVRRRRHVRPFLTRKRLVIAAVFASVILILRRRSSQSLHPLRHFQRVQFPFAETHYEHESNIHNASKRAAAVRTEFEYAYAGYKAVAWGNDEVSPVTGTPHTSRNGFAETLIDGLTTALVMNITGAGVAALDYVANNLDFSSSAMNGIVDPFETTIRVLGALVSAADILVTNDIFGPVPRQSEYRAACILRAKQLAKRLAPAYDSPLGMPWPRVDFSKNLGVHELDWGRDTPFSATPASVGTSWLEYHALSRLTKDKRYLRTATRAWAPLVHAQARYETILGHMDSPFDGFTGKPTGHSTGLGAGYDSYYEYLIKAAILAPRDSEAAVYAAKWTQAMESAFKSLAYAGEPSDDARTGLLFIASRSGDMYINEMNHLVCFLAGNLMLGGTYLDRTDLVRFGGAVLETCRAMYASTATRLGPESVVWESHPFSHAPDVKFTITTGDEAWHEQEQLHKLGFWISDARYLLRPEVVESYFYAFRITGDERYRDWAWEAFCALRKYSKTTYGYGEIEDVSLPNAGGPPRDRCESYFMAETLKYLYLIFDDPDRLSLDRWVFSTEGHPIRIS